MRDLRSEPVFRVRLNGQPQSASLATTLALLSDGAPVEFYSLRPYVEPAWHAFLTHVGALAMIKAGIGELPTDGEVWSASLLELTDGKPEPWWLVSDDLAKPAFFQPPVPERTVGEFNRSSTSPEILDVLVTAKNHDVKAEPFTIPMADDWAYALLAHQTLGSYAGRGLYPISKLSSGYSSRALVGVVPSMDWSARFRRDVPRLIEHRSSLLASDAYDFSASGKALLWTSEWNGSSSLPTNELDPLYVEICRRVRLTETNGVIEAHLKPTEGPRIEAAESAGVLGDFWTPVRRTDPPTALNVPATGFHYELMTELLFPGGDYDAAPAQEVMLDDGDQPLFLAQTLARGQGQTRGFHERIVPLPHELPERFGRRDQWKKLGTIARERISAAKAARFRILQPAICGLVQAPEEGERLDFRDPFARRFGGRLDALIDRDFFQELFRDVKLTDAQAERRWHRTLMGWARELFEEAVENAPKPDARHFRAISLASRVFNGSARQHLAGAFVHEEDSQNDA